MMSHALLATIGQICGVVALAWKLVEVAIARRRRARARAAHGALMARIDALGRPGASQAEFREVMRRVGWR